METHWIRGTGTKFFSVTNSFATDDPPLWSPLLSLQVRRQAFADFSGLCINCGERNHNMRQCGAGFLNLAGVLNPELGQLQDGGDAFRRWQRRLLSYRRGHRNLSLATSQLRPRNTGRYSRQSTALVPRAQDARLNDRHQGPRRQQGFLRLPPPPHFSSQQQNAVPTTAMVPANQNMRHGHTTGGNDPHGRHPGTHRSTP